MAAVGAPDPRQVDGLGGADMLLSKVAIVSGSVEAGIDIECEFANIAPGKDRPTYGTNCGNLVSAVALFAIDEGFVPVHREDSAIRIRNRNSGDLIEARIGLLASDTPDASRTAGMSDTGVSVDLDFIDPVGAATRSLLPTGTARETVILGDDCSVDISVIDAGALYVFVRAADLGLTATESASELAMNPAATDALERIRSLVAQKIGIADLVSDVTQCSPDVPKLAFVGPAASYHCNNGPTSIAAKDVDLVSRIISSQSYHGAYAVTAAIATASAAAVPGTVVSEAIGEDLPEGVQAIRIGHPSGVMTCRVESQMSGEYPEILRAGLSRSARRIMQGSIIIPNRCFR
jgi:2-methylaconitate cis-trans-isomerase PrpF